jgi:K+-transporting ATPase KdpF subunit
MSLAYLASIMSTVAAASSSGGGSISGVEYLLTGLVALGVAIYLAIALLRPDKF